MLTCAGDWSAAWRWPRAKQLNPHHPGWYWWVDFYNASGRATTAARLASRSDESARPLVHARGDERRLRAARGTSAATKALQDLLTIRPDFAATVRMNIEKWWEPDFVELRWTAGARRGWRSRRSGEASASPSSMSQARPAPRRVLGRRSAFQYAGTSAELKTLADGLSEEVITGLSRFSYLRVIARGSTTRNIPGKKAGDVRAIGKELGARYVMEGNLRQAGTKLRVAVQLVDAVSGAHLWAESYERPFSPESVFELQDDLVPQDRIDRRGNERSSATEHERGCPQSSAPEQLSPYEAVLRSFGYLERVTPEELAVSRSGLEMAVAKAPDYADAWAMLALLCLQDYAQGFGLQPDSLASGLNAARRAVEAAPSSPLALFSLAQALFFRKNSRASGTRRSGLPRSIRWTATPSLFSVSC